MIAKWYGHTTLKYDFKTKCLLFVEQCGICSQGETKELSLTNVKLY